MSEEDSIAHTHTHTGSAFVADRSGACGTLSPAPVVTASSAVSSAPGSNFPRETRSGR